MIRQVRLMNNQIIYGCHNKHLRDTSIVNCYNDERGNGMTILYIFTAVL